MDTFLEWFKSVPAGLLVFVAGSTITLSVVLWLVWRRWVWNNIFGICMVKSVAFSIPTIRLTVGEWVGLEVTDSPHWAIPLGMGVLHFLATNRRDLSPWQPSRTLQVLLIATAALWVASLCALLLWNRPSPLSPPSPYAVVIVWERVPIVLVVLAVAATVAAAFFMIRRRHERERRLLDEAHRGVLFSVALPRPLFTLGRLVLWW